MRNKGRLICVEGLDQSGKKTQVNFLRNKLRRQGFQVEVMTFPDYTTLLGGQIKAFLAGQKKYGVHVRHLLYAANRWERKEEIESWLNNERLVIVDRYSPSNLAYGLANGLDLDWLLNLEKGLPETDLVIVIDTSPEVSFERKSVGRDLYERNLSFLKKVWKAYKELSQRFHWIVVDGEKSVKSVHDDIWKVVDKYLKDRS